MFWSGPGAKAPVHYDEYDIIVIQLEGSKRWFVSTDPPGLNNQWKRPGETPPTMERYQTVTLEPGDVAYLPRGTPHTVESLTESIHLSIGFVPVTLRDAMIAAIDLLSDRDRSLRTGVAPEAGATNGGNDALADQVRAAFGLLLASSDAGFMDEAMALRSARMVFDLPKLAPANAAVTIGAQTRVRHTPLAIAHLTTDPRLGRFLSARQPHPRPPWRRGKPALHRSHGRFPRGRHTGRDRQRPAGRPDPEVRRQRFSRTFLNGKPRRALVQAIPGSPARCFSSVTGYDRTRTPVAL